MEVKHLNGQHMGRQEYVSGGSSVFLVSGKVSIMLADPNEEQHCERLHLRHKNI
jgi:hypothetical protein